MESYKEMIDRLVRQGKARMAEQEKNNPITKLGDSFYMLNGQMVGHEAFKRREWLDGKE